MKLEKRIAAVFLLIIAAVSLTLGVTKINARTNSAAPGTQGSCKFYVPEMIYLKPAASATTFEYYADCDSSGTRRISR